MAGNSNPDGKGLVHFCQVAKIDGNVLLYCFFFTSFFSSLILLTPKKIIIFPSIELAKKNEVTFLSVFLSKQKVQLHHAEIILTVCDSFFLLCHFPDRFAVLEFLPPSITYY